MARGTGHRADTALRTVVPGMARTTASTVRQTRGHTVPAKSKTSNKRSVSLDHTRPCSQPYQKKIIIEFSQKKNHNRKRRLIVWSVCGRYTGSDRVPPTCTRHHVRAERAGLFDTVRAPRTGRAFDLIDVIHHHRQMPPMQRRFRKGGRVPKRNTTGGHLLRLPENAIDHSY